MDERYKLFSKAIDGELSAEESDRLDSLLKSDDEAAEELARWRYLDGLLASKPMAEPPSYLAGMVLDRVYTGRKRLSFWRRSFAVLAALYLAISLATVAFVGLHLPLMFAALTVGVRVMADAEIMARVLCLFADAVSGVVLTTFRTALLVYGVGFTVLLILMLLVGRRPLAMILTKSGEG
jgi:anti-sigma factor RsiW